MNAGSRWLSMALVALCFIFNATLAVADDDDLFKDAFLKAVQNKEFSEVETLSKDVSPETKSEGLAAALAVYQGDEGREKMILLLEDKGAGYFVPFESKYSGKTTAFHALVGSGDLDRLKKLLEGANVADLNTLVDTEKGAKSPLTEARSAAVAELLLNKGAKLMLPGKKSAFDDKKKDEAQVTLEPSPELAKLFLARGLDPLVNTINGETYLTVISTDFLLHDKARTVDLLIKKAIANGARAEQLDEEFQHFFFYMKEQYAFEAKPNRGLTLLTSDDAETMVIFAKNFRNLAQPLMDYAIESYGAAVRDAEAAYNYESGAAYSFDRKAIQEGKERRRADAKARTLQIFEELLGGLILAGAKPQEINGAFGELEVTTKLNAKMKKAYAELQNGSVSSVLKIEFNQDSDFDLAEKLLTAQEFKTPAEYNEVVDYLKKQYKDRGKSPRFFKLISIITAKKPS